MNTSDDVLFHDWVVRRDPEAMATIVERYSGLVYGTARRILNNSTEAEDVAQECFLKLASVSHAGASLPGLLHTMATRQAFNLIRSESRRRAREERFVELRGETVELAWNDVVPHVDAVIAELPDKYQTPLVRHFLAGESHETIAQAMGLSRSGVSRRITKGIQLARRGLKRRGIPVASAALGSMLLQEGVEAAPRTLAEQLGKVAISGFAHEGATALHTPAWGTMGKLLAPRSAALFLVAVGTGLLGLMTSVVRNEAPSLAATPAAPEAVSAETTAPPAPVVAAAVVESTVEIAATEQPAPGTVHGVVRSETGFPRPAVYLSQDWTNRIYWGAESDDNGQFELERGPDAAASWLAYSQNTQTASLFKLPPDGTQSPLEITLDCELIDVSGLVLDPDGKGVAKAQVQLRITDESGAEFIAMPLTANVHGYYDCETMPRRRGLAMQARILFPETAPGPWSAPQDLGAVRHHLEVPTFTLRAEEAEAIASRQSIAHLNESQVEYLQRGPEMAHYSGLIEDEAGNPIGGAKIWLGINVEGGMRTALAASGADGRWKRLLPKDLPMVDLRVQHAEYVSTIMSRDHALPSAQQMRDGSARVVLSRGLPVRGMLRDETGKPVGDALVLTHSRYSRTPGGPESTSNAPIEDLTCTRTPAEGTFQLACLPAGKQILQIICPGFASKLVSINITGDLLFQTIVLDRGTTIRGRILNEEGGQGFRI
ncbi:MAG: sigma-70 family RNA polymerase sigma factor [Candidatus Hydrogenedentes bacterium]|nr:sigma-70 family RNA polymerase sigma factor [Candidatus Hydrogenedentota bacterium]